MVVPSISLVAVWASSLHPKVTKANPLPVLYVSVTWPNFSNSACGGGKLQAALHHNTENKETNLELAVGEVLVDAIDKELAALLRHGAGRRIERR
jgi:hypothetical protein